MTQNSPMSRRDFLKILGGTGVAAAASSAVPNLGADMQQPKNELTRSIAEFVKETPQPTYVKDIVGEISRFDERARAFSKAMLVEGDGFYEKFIELFPELKDHPQQLASYRDPAPVRAERAGISLTGYLLANTSFSPGAYLGAEEIVEPKVAEKQMPIDPQEMARRVKEFCKAMGAADVKIGPLDQRWIYSHRGMAKNDSWGQEITLSHKTAISMAFKQDVAAMNNLAGPAANLEIGKIYVEMAVTSIALVNLMAGMGYASRAHHYRNYQVLQVPVAIDAGLGELSRAGFLLHPELGTNFRLATVTTDMPLAYDQPIDFGVQVFCANCKICADACPSGAISHGEKVVRNGVKVWDIDEIKCLSYWGTNGLSCGICQISCPWTKHGNWVHELARGFASSGGGAAATILARLDKVFYGEYTDRKDPDWLT